MCLDSCLYRRPEQYETEFFISQALVYRLQTLSQLESVFLSLIDTAPSTLTVQWQTGEAPFASTTAVQVSS